MRRWHREWVSPVGGLTEVAADESCRYLLVVSASGRGVYELATGDRVARDHEAPRYDSDWLDATERRVRGIGPLEDVWLAAVGLWGGSLPQSAGEDRLAIAGDPRGAERFVLRSSDAETTLESQIITEIRAVGFLREGEIIILATSSDVSVFAASYQGQ